MSLCEEAGPSRGWGCSPRNPVDPTVVVKPPELCCVTVCPVKGVPASEASLTVRDRGCTY